MSYLPSDVIKISVAAKILGYPTHQLRRWDKQGILKPTVVAPSGHRYYSMREIVKFRDLT